MCVVDEKENGNESRHLFNSCVCCDQGGNIGKRPCFFATTKVLGQDEVIREVVSSSTVLTQTVQPSNRNNTSNQVVVQVDDEHNKKRERRNWTTKLQTSNNVPSGKWFISCAVHHIHTIVSLYPLRYSFLDV